MTEQFCHIGNEKKMSFDIFIHDDCRPDAIWLRKTIQLYPTINIHVPNTVCGKAFFQIECMFCLVYDGHKSII